MSNNPLEASIHLSLHNDVSAGLAKIASELLGLHGNVDKLKGSLKDVVSGAVKLSVAFGMAEFIADLTKANGLLERQLNIFRMTGNSAADTDALRKAAYDAAVKVRGVGVVEQAKLARELSAALQDNPGARSVLPDFARAKAVISFATGRDNDDDTTRLAKMIELRGGAVNPKTDKIDPEMFRKELDAATKAIVVGQGLLTTNDLQQMIKQGGPAMKNFRGNPAAFWADNLALAEDMGGARAGTAKTAIARQVLGGIMTPKVASEWERLGMLSKEGNGWAHDKKGNIVIDDPSKAIRGYGAFQHGGVEEFIDKFVKPAFDKAGIKEPDAINAEMYRFGSTETARRAYGLYLSNDAQIRAVHDRYYKSMGVDGYDKVVKNDMIFNEEAVKTSFETLKTALGDAAGVAPVLGSIADGINKLAKATSEQPNIGKAVTWGGGAAAAGLGGYGAWQMIRGLLSMRNGFGLPKAAGELTVAAKALDAAAAKLTGAAVSEEAAATAMRTSALPSIGGKSALLGLNLGYAAFNATPDIKVDPKGQASFKPIYGDQVKSFDEWFKTNAPPWLQPGAGAEFAKRISGSLDGIEKSIEGEVKSWPGKLTGAIATMGSDIVGEITGAFSGLGGKIAKFLHLSSFEGGGSDGGGFINASYTTGDDATVAQRALGGGVVNNGTLNVFAGGAAGGGFMNASYGGGGGGGGRGWNGRALAVGGGTGIGHTASQQERAAFIKSHAASIGIDPTTALRVAQSEGFYKFTGDNGTSFGDFQMHVGGGLGDRLRRMGINPADPNQWKQSDKVALDVARREGWGAWHGAAHVGIGNHQGIGIAPVRPPPTKHEHHITTTVNLDGKTIGQNVHVAKGVTKQQTKMAKMPHAIGGQDDYGSWASPGTTMMPA